MTRAFPLARWALSTGLLTLVMAATGRIGDPVTETYLGLFAGLGLARALATCREVALEEWHGPEGIVDPGVRVLASFLFLAVATLAAVDAGRFHWSPSLPTSMRIFALLVVAFFGSLQVGAMAVNPFFSASLWLQPDHRLVARGPYRFLRHPGYLAMLFTVPATAIALGSLVGLVPALGYQLLILRRTRREDRLLRESLGGYAEYAGTVRYRLVPGLW